MKKVKRFFLGVIKCIIFALASSILYLITDCIINKREISALPDIVVGILLLQLLVVFVAASIYVIIGLIYRMRNYSDED